MKSNVIVVGGKSYIKSKVVMLPTIHSTVEKGLIGHTRDKGYFISNETKYYPETRKQHLYFLSSEEIKEGDWVYDRIHKKVYQEHDGMKDRNGFKVYEKIIASTDESLDYFPEGSGGKVSLSLPRPSNEFLQAYCKANGKIDEVLVEVEKIINTSGSTKEELDRNQFIEYKLKVSPDNTITIKRVEKLSPEAEFEIQNALQDKFDEGYRQRMKDEEEMYSKEDMYKTFFHIPQEPESTIYGKREFNKWIEENL